MIRATELGGRAVVDMDAAEKVGKVDKVILDPDARRIAGFEVAHGGSLLGSPTRVNLPASSVHAIGPDAAIERLASGASLACAPKPRGGEGGSGSPHEAAGVASSAVIVVGRALSGSPSEAAGFASNAVA